MPNPSSDWINENDRLSLLNKSGVNEFIRVNEFIHLARFQSNRDDKYRCPYKTCNNVIWHDIGVIRSHLLIYEFTPNYIEWYHHGEPRRTRITQEADIGIDQRCIGGLHDAIHHIMDHEDFNDLANPTPSELRAEEQVDDLFADLEAELYLGCKYFFDFIVLVFVDALRSHEPLDEQIVHWTFATSEEVSFIWLPNSRKALR